LTQEILMDTVAMIKPVDKEGAGQGRNRFFSCQWWK
jgi:hypothetical protein